MNLSNYFFKTHSTVLIYSMSRAACWHFILCMKLRKPLMSDSCQKFPASLVPVPSRGQCSRQCYSNAIVPSWR